MDNRKTEIIETASKLFKERGYSAVTMRDLAAAMGIKAASLYNHINSKQEILSVIIIDIAEEFTRNLDKIKAAENTSTVKLYQIIRLHVKITSENMAGMASLNNDWMHLEGKLDYYLELRSSYEGKFRSILLNGIETGEFKDMDVEVILFSILSTLRSLYLWIPKKENLDIDKFADNLSAVLVNGVAK
ncbi:MAG: TetR/AcrR family transcriptional regulator [Flavobacteriaceae bacterium]|nr:TetR/AcrR family transcriptional regulator [Flavobacteriaceae bacterium]